MSNPRYKRPINRRDEANTKLGLASLLWMLIGAIIAVMIGVFFYLSPLFDGFSREVDVNPDAQVTPLPQDTPPTSEYEFYEILPKREFRGDTPNLEDSNDTAAVSTRIDAVVEAPKHTKEQEAQITVVEEDETYDEPSPTSTKNEENIHIEASKRTYILQIRSYDNPEDADRKRAEVRMTGIEAKVVRRLDIAGEELYQVVSNPTNSKEDIIKMRQHLSNNGIDALIIEQRR